MSGFELWWRDHGSGVGPQTGHDVDEHARDVARAAWESCAEIERLRFAVLSERDGNERLIGTLVRVAMQLSSDENRIIGALMKATGGTVNPMVIQSMIRSRRARTGETT